MLNKLKNITWIYSPWVAIIAAVLALGSLLWSCEKIDDVEDTRPTVSVHDHGSATSVDQSVDTVETDPESLPDVDSPEYAEETSEETKEVES